MSWNCRICGQPAPHLMRCEEHYRCDECGSKENLCFRGGGLTCDPCYAEIIERAIADFAKSGKSTDGDTECTCPWCGYVHQDGWEMNDGDHECSRCDRVFCLEKELYTVYSTSKPKATASSR